MMNRPRLISFFVTLLFAAGVTSGQSIEKNDPDPTVSRELANSLHHHAIDAAELCGVEPRPATFYEVPIWQLPG